MTSRLSSLLVQDGLVSAQRMTDAFKRQAIYGGSLDTNLLEMRVIDEEALLPYLGRASGVPTQPAGISAMGNPTSKVLKAFPHTVAERFHAVPGDSADGGVLRVLVADPVEPQNMEELAQTIHQRVEPWIAPEFRLIEAMDIIYGVPMPPRFLRLLSRSKQAFEGRPLPAPRLIDPVPRFGNLQDYRLDGGPAVPAETTPGGAGGEIGALLQVALPGPSATTPPQVEAPRGAAPPSAAPPKVAAPPSAAPRGEAPPSEAPIVEPAEDDIVDEAPLLARVDGVPEPISENPVVPVKIPEPVRPLARSAATPSRPEPPRPRPRVQAPPSESPRPQMPKAEDWLIDVGDKSAPVATSAAATVVGAAATATPGKQAEPAQPIAQQAQKDEPQRPAAQPAQPSQPAQPAQPVAQQARLAEPQRPAAQPAQPSQPAQQAQKAEPQRPAVQPAAAKPETAPQPQRPALLSPQPHQPGGKKKKKRRSEAPKIPPAAPIVPKPIIIPPGQVAQAGTTSSAKRSEPVAAVAGNATWADSGAEPSVVVTDLPSEVRAADSDESGMVKPQEMPTPPGGTFIDSDRRSAASDSDRRSAASDSDSDRRSAAPASDSDRRSAASDSDRRSAASDSDSAIAKRSGALAASATDITKRSSALAASVTDSAKRSGAQSTDRRSEDPAPVGRVTSEYTPLPSPLPPPSEFSGPNASLVSGLHGVVPIAPVRESKTAKVSEPIPVPIDSGRLGEQIIHGHHGTSAPLKEIKPVQPIQSDTRTAPRVAVAIPLAESRPAPLSLPAAREIIAGAEERDAIFEALCRAVRGKVAFAAVFTVHGDVAFGRIALEHDWLDRQALGKVAVPLDRPSAFRIAVKGRSPYIGRLGDQPSAGEPLSAIGRRPPLPGAVLPVLVRGRAVALLYLDDGGRELKNTLLDELRPLMGEVSQAFQRLVLHSRAGGFGDADGRGRVQEEMGAPTTSSWRQPEGSPRERRVRGATLAKFSTEPQQPSQIIEVRDPPAPTLDPEAVVKRPVSGDATPKASSDTPTSRLRKGQVEPKVSAPATSQAAAPATTTAATPKTTLPGAAVPVAEVAPPEPAAKGSAGKGRDRARAAAALKAVSQPDVALAELIKYAAAGDEPAATALCEGGEDAARAVVMALPGPLKNRERQALGDPIGEPVFARGPLLALVPRLGEAAVAPLIERMQNPVTPPEVRYYLALCFTEMPYPEAIAALGQRLFDSDDAVRMAAVSALRNYPPSQELRDLLDTLRSELLGPDAKRQLQAVEALGELRDVQAMPRLFQLLGHGDLLLSDATAKALQVLAKQDFGRSKLRWRWWWRSHQAEPRLRWVLGGLVHPSAEVRASAQDELRSLSGDVTGYRFDLPRREREAAQQRWTQWWQRRGYPV